MNTTMPSKHTTPRMMRRAAELRRNPTEAEAKLWKLLRAHQLDGVGFRRQHAIGQYIVDFCAPRRKLIIELDGSQHLDQQIYDEERSAFLEAQGYCVLRFWNNDVLRNTESVMEVIQNTLQPK
jgi:very-short-patch-repair endonuclease